MKFKEYFLMLWLSTAVSMYHFCTYYGLQKEFLAYKDFWKFHSYMFKLKINIIWLWILWHLGSDNAFYRYTYLLHIENNLRSIGIMSGWCFF